MAAAFASGYVVALVLGVLLVDAQVRGWNEDAMVIGAFARSFNGTERSLHTFLATKDFAWANESAWWIGIAQDLAFRSYRGSGFPSGPALGLTWPDLYCLGSGLSEFLRGLQGNTSDLDRLELMQIIEDFAGRFDILWTDLRTVEPRGSDPLIQLGPERIQSIRAAIGELRTMGERWNRFCF